MTRALLLLLLCSPLAAELPEQLRDAVSDLARPSAPAGGGWAKAGDSLLLYDREGRLADEIGLGRWKESSSEAPLTRRVEGGVSADGRFAWRWESLSGASRRRRLSYFDASGAELWENALADAPPGLAPAVLSRDGKAALVAERDAEGWAVAAVDERGRRLLAARAGSRIEAMRLTESGRYGLVLHRGGPEDVLMYTFLDLASRAQRDFPAHELPPGQVTVAEDGAVRAGPKVFLRLR